jgi:restriction system protein
MRPMKLEMNQNSLFAILLRKPWWMSAAIAAGVFALARVWLPAIYAAFVPLPFIVIAVYAGWQQLRAPSATRVAEGIAVLRGMSWEEFSFALEAAFRREGYDVSRLPGPQADFQLTRAGRTSLVAAKRWKATRTGIEPLRELHAAGLAAEAQELIYVATAEVTENARKFAAEKNIRILQDAELTKRIGVRALKKKS